jgi:hypothetical protein
VLALLAGTADGASKSKRVAFQVTLQATVTKSWNALRESTQNGCPTSERSVGRRTVKLRSTRPTTVVVTLSQGRISYSPAVVRHVRAEVNQSGTSTTSTRAPCKPRVAHSRCPHKQRIVSGASYGFFRSAPNEISFRAARLPEFSIACPREFSGVRAIRPGLQDAEGELSESALMDPRVPGQTALGSAESETDLEGKETGRVIERVSWELTFIRKR